MRHGVKPEWALALRFGWPPSLTRRMQHREVMEALALIGLENDIKKNG